MLIKFTVENWMAFSEAVTLDMQYSETSNNHENHLIEINNNKLLPIASIYGANASGKSSLIKAISFAKRFILRKIDPNDKIQINKNKIVDKYNGKPSNFTFEFYIEEKHYTYSFSITETSIIYEKLTYITKDEKETTLFTRNEKDIDIDQNTEDAKQLNLFKENIRNNVLFLTNTVDFGLKNFIEVYKWFKKLVIIYPDSGLSVDSQDFSELKKLNQAISSLDTNIEEIFFKKANFQDEKINLPNSIWNEIESSFKKTLSDKESLKKKKKIKFSNNSYVSLENDELIMEKLITKHKNTNSKLIDFELTEESDGTQRLIEILPMFLELQKATCGRIFIIDELDRSLHSHIIRELIWRYLKNINKKFRGQLIFTSHTDLILDKQIFRTDEIYLVDKKDSLVTLKSIDDYVGTNEDSSEIWKLFHDGKIGGVPWFSNSISENSNE